MTITQSEWITNFVSMLLDDDPATRRQGFGLKIKNTPPRMYRYRNPAAVAELRSNAIWLSAAYKFNDPFDSAVSIDFGPAMEVGLGNAVTKGMLTAVPVEKLARVATSMTKIDAFGELFADTIVERVGEDTHEKASTFLREFLAEQSAEATRMFSQGLQRRLKLAAFTEIPDSLVLWSHYAANHEGFCVEYDFANHPPHDPMVQALFPVVYTENRFTIGDYLNKLRNGGNVNPAVPILAAIHKSPDWAYEREWRLVQMDNGGMDGVLVPMPQPTSVRIGARMKPDHRTELCQIAKTAGFTAYEMRLSTTDFKLKSVKIAG